MTTDANKFDISSPKDRRKFLSLCEVSLNKFYNENVQNLEKYNKIGEYLSKVSYCCKVIGNIYELDDLLEIKIRAIQLGIEDLVYRDEITEIDDMLMYASEIDWTSNNAKYVNITNFIGDICISINKAEELIVDSQYPRQIQSVEYFRDDLVEILNNLMNTRYILNNDERDYLTGLSKDKQMEFIAVYLHEIERIDRKIANIVKELIVMKLTIKKYI